MVFESDDWGMIRTLSKESLSKLKNMGYPVDGCSYNRLDSTERGKYLSGLLEVLDKYKGPNGKLAKYTLNNVVANPDFDKIQESEYQHHFYQSFVETLKEYPETDAVMDFYRRGIKDEFVQLKFHGSEHLNSWLRVLQADEGISC